MALQWGILGCGKISADFVSALASSPNNDHSVVACGARSVESAQAFADSYAKTAKPYGSYEEVINDPAVQAIYIGTINPTHNGLTKAALTKGKAVLCEKPLGMNVKEVKEVIELAKEKKVFLMEGIWSRCFPAYKSLREELASGSLGEVLHVNAVFGTLLDVKERTSKKEMGGGTILDIGVYNVQLAALVFGGERPLKVLAGGHLNKDGVDESSSASLVYGNGRSATLVTHGRARMSNEAYIVGTKGSIKVPMRFWCPTELETVSKGKLTFELPKTERSFNYANSVGLLYEGDEVRKCLKEGLTESPLMPLDETIVIAEIMEDIRKQVGVVYPQD